MEIEKKIGFLLRTVYGDLRKSEKAAADYIIENMDRITEMTLAEVAKNSGVSQPTVMRTLKAAGYGGFKEMKYAIIAEMAKDDEPDSEINMHGYPVSPEDAVSEIPRKVTAAAVSVIQDTMKSLSVKCYEKAIKVLKTANQIDIYGIENSSAACGDLATKLMYIGYNCRYIYDPYLQKISAASLSEGDVAVGISYSGTSGDTVEAVKTAKEQGATTIVLTNFPDSPISKYADILMCSTHKQIFYGNANFSRLSQILMIDMIYMGLIAEDYEGCTAILQRNSRLIESKALSVK